MVAVLSLSFLIVGCSSPSAPENTAVAEPPPAEETNSNIAKVVDTGQDFSRFLHSNEQHARLPCLLCHTRNDNAATPTLPGHIPCASCHTDQFADSGNAICSVCHTDASSGAMKKFPRLKSFNVRFDHAKHTRQTGCVTCHSPQRRGATFSYPSGLNAHNTCYQCHGPEAMIGGENIGSCATCHEQGRPPAAIKASTAFQKSFSHAAHAGRAKLNCSSCHMVRAGAPRGRQVISPVVAMHNPPKGRQSCATCHNDRRAFGIGDGVFESCKRCHQGGNFSF